MAKLSVRTGVKLDSVAQVQQDLQRQLDNISKKLNIKITNVDFSNISTSLNEINKKINEVINQNKKFTPEIDISGAKKSLNEYSSEVRKKVQEIVSETSKITKINIKTDSNGEFIGATAVAQIDEANQKVLKFNKELQFVGQSYSENDKKLESMFTKQDKFLDNSINKLKQYKQQLQDSNNLSTGTRRTDTVSEIDKQIAKMNELKNSNKILGVAEKTRITETMQLLKSQTSSLTKQSSTLVNMLKQISTYALGGSLIYTGLREIREGINNIIELDSALRDLRKVSDLTTSQLNDFTTSANEMAISVGASTKSAIEATTYYSKLGLAINEASAAAKNAMIFSNIGDMSIDDASKALITTQKGFGFDPADMESTMRILDSFNEVGNNYSSTTKDIADGMTQMGNAMYEAGNSLEETIGVFVAGNAAIQNSDKSGNAIKTITMRLRGMKTEIDETSIPVSKLRDSIKQLTATTGKEVDIMKDDNTFKNTYEILTELSEVYYDLTDGQRAYLQYVIAGQRQGNIFSGIMSNMSEGIEATTTALNSQGSAMKENAIYMDSIDGRINEFSETLNKLWIDSISTDTIKGVISLGTSVISLLDNMVNAFGLVPTVVGVATIAIRLFNKEMYDGMVKNIPLIGSLNNSITNMSNGIKTSLGTIVSKAFMNFRANCTSAKVATASLSAQNVVLATTYGAVSIAASVAQAAISMGISLLITSAITAVMNYCDSLIVTREELIEMNNEIQNNVSTMEKNINTAEKAISTIESLNEQLANTTDMQKREDLTNKLTQAQKDLAAAMPETSDSVDENGVLMATRLENSKSLLDIKKDEQQIEARRFFEENKNAQKDISNLMLKKKAYESMLIAQAKGEDKISSIEKVNAGGIEQTAMTTISFDSKDIEKLNTEINDTITLMGQMNQMGDVLGDNLTESERKVIEEIKNYNIELELNKQKTLENADTQTVLANSALDVEQAMSDTNDTLKEIAGTFDSLGGSIDIVDKVIEEMTKYGGITQSTYSKLMSDYPDVFRAMQKEGDMIQNLTDLKVQYQKEQQQQLNMAWRTVSEETELINNQMESEMSAYNQTADYKIKVDQNKKVSTTDMINFITSSTARMNNALAGMYGDDAKNWATLLQNKSSNFTGFVKSVSSGIMLMSKAVASIAGKVVAEVGFGSNLPNIITTPPSIVNSTSDASKAVQSYTPVLELFYKLNNEIEDVNNSLAINKERQENAFGSDKKRLLEEEIKLLEKQKNLYSQLMNEQKSKISSVKNQLASLGASFDSSGNIVNYEQLLGKTATGDKAIENLKNLESLIKSYTDLTQSELPKCEQEWEKLNNQIGDAYKSMAETVSDAEQEIYKIIESYAKKKSDAKIKEINKQIEAEKKRYDSENQEQDFNKKNRELSELKAEMDKFALATDELGKAKFEQLKKQYEEARNELNDTIKDAAHEDNISSMEDEIDKIEKELEDFLSSEEMNNIITNAMKTGVVQIGDEVIKLDDVMTDFYKNSVIGQETLNIKLKEMIEMLQTAQELSTMLPEINNGANIQQIKSIPVVPSMTKSEISTVNNQTNEAKVEVVINVQGDATDETISKMEKVAKKAVQDGIKEYDKSFK